MSALTLDPRPSRRRPGRWELIDLGSGELAAFNLTEAEAVELSIALRSRKRLVDALRWLMTATQQGDDTEWLAAWTEARDVLLSIEEDDREQRDRIDEAGARAGGSDEPG